jgi:hypothetical protein
MEIKNRKGIEKTTMKTSRELPPFSEENYHKASAELIREA